MRRGQRGDRRGREAEWRAGLGLGLGLGLALGLGLGFGLALGLGLGFGLALGFGFGLGLGSGLGLGLGSGLGLGLLALLESLLAAERELAPCLGEHGGHLHASRRGGRGPRGTGARRRSAGAWAMQRAAPGQALRPAARLRPREVGPGLGLGLGLGLRVRVGSSGSGSG